MATTLTTILKAARDHVAAGLRLDASCVVVALDDDPPAEPPSDLFVTVSPGPSSDLPEADTFGGDDDDSTDPVVVSFDVRATLFVRSDRDPAGRDDSILTKDFPALDRLMGLMQSWRPTHAGEDLLYRQSQFKRMEPRGRSGRGNETFVRFAVVAPVQFVLDVPEGVTA